MCLRSAASAQRPTHYRDICSTAVVGNSNETFLYRTLRGHVERTNVPSNFDTFQPVPFPQRQYFQPKLRRKSHLAYSFYYTNYNTVIRPTVTMTEAAAISAPVSRAIISIIIITIILKSRKQYRLPEYHYVSRQRVIRIRQQQ